MPYCSLESPETRGKIKIGIITFHWATNYGAVLQAYALQRFLSQRGYVAQIIDYRPRAYEKNIMKCVIRKPPWLIFHNVIDYLKEMHINAFRDRHLHLSQKYSSYEELRNSPPPYDVYICGSDQIWNRYFTAGGEGKLTLSYLLDFGSTSVKRIAYAVSFGCVEYPIDLLKIISPHLSKFDAISVREDSGCEILNKAGIGGVKLMPDPTLLLTQPDYEQLISISKNVIRQQFVFFYSLHRRQKTIARLRHYFRHNLCTHVIRTCSIINSTIGIEDWLNYIKLSDITVTNSYHGVLLSIIFRKPFIAVPVEGSGSAMNDRIFTILGQLGLQDRILMFHDENRINTILNQNIDWDCVENEIASLRNDALCYFDENL